MTWFSRDKRYRRPERGSMRWRLAKLFNRFSSFPPSAFVEGLLVAMLTARREVPQNVLAPLVLGDEQLEGDAAEAVIGLVMLAWEELHAVMLSDPGSCVPPANTQKRLDWCRGFVTGMSKEPPPDSKLAVSIVISMDVLSGGFPFEELELEVAQTEQEWRRGIEENLPDLVLTVVAEISKKALKKTQKRKRGSRRKRKA